MSDKLTENYPKQYFKTSKNLPEAFPDYPEIANKPIGFSVVNIFGFVVITRHHQVGFRKNLQKIHSTSLPDLSKPYWTSKYSGNLFFLKMCRAPNKNSYDY